MAVTFDQFEPQEFLRQVLAEVNTVRQAVGFPPLNALPQGVRSHPYKCVLQRAFAELGEDVGVDTENVRIFSRRDTMEQYARRLRGAGISCDLRGQLRVNFSYLIATFVRLFDLGYFPELEQPENGEKKSQLHDILTHTNDVVTGNLTYAANSISSLKLEYAT